MRGGEKQAGEEREVIDEEAELHRVARPGRGAVEGEAEEQHIGRGQKRRGCEECAGQEGEGEPDLEDGGKPGEGSGKGKPAAAM